MARKRDPIGITVNGAHLFVKDPNAAAAAFWGSFRRVPGLGSFTLPAEAGSVNEIALMDGTVAAAQARGVGTITGTIGALGAHPTHLFMEGRAGNQSPVQISIIRTAVGAGERELAVGADVTAPVGANGSSLIVIGDGGIQAWVNNSVRAGHLIAYSSDTSAGMVTMPTDVFRSYDGSTLAAEGDWQTVMDVKDGGTEILVSPGFEVAVAVIAGEPGMLWLRNPGRSYQEIVGVVNQWDAGDFQNGSVVSGNMSFTPSAALPVVTPEHRTNLPSDYLGGLTP